MVSANREMVVYCFDTLVAHYNSEDSPPPAFDEGQHPLFVTWKKVVNGSEPRLRGCIGTLEARCLINGFRDYALTRPFTDAKSCVSCADTKSGMVQRARKLAPALCGSSLALSTR